MLTADSPVPLPVLRLLLGVRPMGREVEAKMDRSGAWIRAQSLRGERTQDSLLPRSVGFQMAGSAELGVGLVHGGAKGTVGVGRFSDTGAGGFVSGGATIGTPWLHASAPRGSSHPVVIAADLGFSGGVFFSNARSPAQLAGTAPQTDFQFSLGIVGVDLSWTQSGSIYLFTGGICVFTCIGAGVSRYDTYTVPNRNYSVP